MREHDEHTVDWDRLRRLLQQARTGSDGAIDLPPEETLWAYASGKATEKERARVDAALDRSATFRTEFLALMEEYAFLSSAEAAAAFDAIEVSGMPRLPQAHTSPAARVIDRVRAFMAPRRVLAAAAVIACVCLFIIIRPFITGKKFITDVSAEKNTILVMPFENQVAIDDPDMFGAMIGGLLIADISASESVDAVSLNRLHDLLEQRGLADRKIIDRISALRVAINAGARWAVLGRVVETAPAFIVTGRLIDVMTGSDLAAYRIEGESGAELFSLVDSLCARIKRDLELPPGSAGSGDTPVESITTHSIVAYRHYLEGLDDLFKKYRENAKVSFEKAIAIDSTFALAYLALANMDLPTTIDEKRHAIDKALQFSGNASSKDRLYIESLREYIYHNYDEAKEKLERFIHEYPQEKDAYRDLASLYFGRLDYRKSIGNYLSLVALDPLDKLAYNRLAYLYYFVGNIDSSMVAIDRYIALAPDDANPYDTRGDLYAWNGQLDEAIASYETALSKNPVFYPSLQNLGHMYLLKGEYEKARRCYEALMKSPDSGARMRARAFLACIPLYQGRLEEALRLFSEGIEEDEKEGVHSEETLWKFFNRSLILIEQGNYASAWEDAGHIRELRMRYFEDDLSADPGIIIYLLALEGRFEEAERELGYVHELIERKHPSQMYAYWFSKGIIEFGKRDYDAACREFERAVKAYPQFFSRYWLARAYLAAGRDAEASDQFESLSSYYGDNRVKYALWSVKLFYYAGEAYERTGRRTEAIDQYRRFLDILKNADPGIEEVNKARQHLAALEKNV